MKFRIEEKGEVCLECIRSYYVDLPDGITLDNIENDEDLQERISELADKNSKEWFVDEVLVGGASTEDAYIVTTVDPCSDIDHTIMEVAECIADWENKLAAGAMSMN